jgi:hypothetical protein
MPHAALAENLCEAVPRERRRIGANPVSSWPRLSFDYGALPRVQAELGGTCE